MSQEQIDRGRALSRLLENEDFAILAKEWDERISYLQGARDNWDETPMSDSHSLTRLQHRLAALKGLREWISDEIEIGGKHKAEQENA